MLIYEKGRVQTPPHASRKARRFSKPDPIAKYLGKLDQVIDLYSKKYRPHLDHVRFSISNLKPNHFDVVLTSMVTVFAQPLHMDSFPFLLICGREFMTQAS